MTCSIQQEEMTKYVAEKLRCRLRSMTLYITRKHNSLSLSRVRRPAEQSEESEVQPLHQPGPGTSPNEPTAVAVLYVGVLDMLLWCGLSQSIGRG